MHLNENIFKEMHEICLSGFTHIHLSDIKKIMNVSVEIEDRHDRDQIHVSFVVRLDGSNVAPIGVVALGRTRNLIEG